MKNKDSMKFASHTSCVNNTFEIITKWILILLMYQLHWMHSYNLLKHTIMFFNSIRDTSIDATVGQVSNRVLCGQCSFCILWCDMPLDNPLKYIVLVSTRNGKQIAFLIKKQNAIFCSYRMLNQAIYKKMDDKEISTT